MPNNLTRVAIRSSPSRFWIVALTIAIFAPMMGRGLLHDDYLLLSSAAKGSLWSGLTRADTFYTPLTWLTFKADWVLWHASPFAMASFNLLLHLINILLIYQVALRFLRSQRAAWWSAFGFALLFPANSWAVMWIATRAHLLVTTFCLAAMLATLHFIETRGSRWLPGAAIVAFAVLALFSKENGITVPAIVGLMLLHDRISRGRDSVPSAPVVGLFAAIAGMIVIYGLIRAESGAVLIHSGDGAGYSYAFSLKVLIDNSLRYAWRTFGLLSLLAGAAAVTQFIQCHRQGHRPSLRGLPKSDLLFSIVLFAVTISPVVLIGIRSGIYTYLPGISAALLLGTFMRSLQEPDSAATSPVSRRAAFLSLIPIVVVAGIFVGFTCGYSQKWKHMAETNSSVMNQIAALQGSVAPGSFIVLTYDAADDVHRFPDGFATWGFRYALRILYEDPSMDGRIVLRGTPDSAKVKPPVIHFIYRLDENNMPQVVRESETSP